jgi:diguanylate cyclase (GGDEF)-like protein
MTAIADATGFQSAKSNGLINRLNVLSLEFGGTLDSKVKEVRRIWSLVPSTPSRDEARDALVKIHDIVHTLAGAGKSFGFPQISKMAAPLDGLFRLITEHNHPLTKEEIDQIDVLIGALERAVQTPRQEINLDDLVDQSAEQGDQSDSFQVLILGTGNGNAKAIGEGLAAFGYPSIIVETADDIPANIAQGIDGAVFADISNGDAHLSLIRQNLGLSHLPLILASSQSGFEDRLRAVRAGATVFLTKPFSTDELFDHLNALNEMRRERPYRIVIAEDDGPLAAFYQATLEHAGMETRVIQKPSKLLETLSGFDPDLIVMDLYMPECTGLELAQIVRQFPGYTTVPILFLSTESRLDLQLKARHLGADDFLPKPLQPGQLISGVTSRANRYRDLKKLTDRDSLTGLLNHSNILRNLEREINLASRTGHPVSFAMVDIDHFKSVNDTYGHVVGDHVIMRVTHLIKNRLRRVDYVGRYGGEEFAVVMPNTDAVKAKEVMDKLREAASEMEYETDKGPFSVTFSVGIATYPNHQSAADITQAADEALYKAKHGGRNQVATAD